MIFSEQNQEISKALVSAWGQIESPMHNTNVTVKTRSGSTYTFSYTDLNGIFDAIKAVYKENKIAVLQNASTYEVNGAMHIAVETMLLHESGEWVKSEQLTAVASGNMQDLGGQITYMKRYSLSAMLGIATEKDDDANGVSGNTVEYTNKPKNPNGIKPQTLGTIKAEWTKQGYKPAALAAQIQKLHNKGITELTEVEAQDFLKKLSEPQEEGA